MKATAKAEAVKTLAACEKALTRWQHIRSEALADGDTDTAEIARQVADSLLDLRAILTEHLNSIGV